ncbi:MAG: drug/metabolite transporter (DMT)-like permease [Parasphingorhabdus sp.]|jgi:drug/metabolite transporter (DMT)-like permease
MVKDTETDTDRRSSSNTTRGIWLMGAGFAAFSCGDLIAKLLTADFHPFQVVWARQFGVVSVVIVFFVLKGKIIFRSVAPKMQLLRGLCAIISASCFIFAISYVALADAIAVTFAAPFIVTVLGATILGEKVGMRRWIAVLVGFIGTLIILRPGADVFHPAIFLVLLASMAFATRQIVSRFIGSRDPTLTTLAYTALTTFLVLALPMPWYWKTPETLTPVLLMVGLTLFAGLGEFLIIRALELADAVVVTPMHYTLIFYSTLWGFLFFGDFPDYWTWLGTFIVIASGIYMHLRETRRQKGLE